MGFALAAVLMMSAVPALASPAIPSARKVKIGDRALDYRVYRKSDPGKFLFALYDATLSRDVLGRTTLAVLDSSGKIDFQRSFAAKFEPLVAMDFRRLEPGIYSYFLSTVEGLHWPSSLHFLDRTFRDVFPREVPNGDFELNSHEVHRGRNGNYFFLFYRDRFADGLVDAEIQEWDVQGGRKFTWNSRDELSPAPGSGPTIDYVHLNSIEQDTDGDLLVSLAETSEVVKLSYPGGKVRWKMSYRDWTFPQDPLRGFRHQHSVRRLPNGNLLFFDNGGFGREPISRAVEYRLDEKAKTATLVWEYRASGDDRFRAAGGSAQRLANGDTVIGWGRSASTDPLPRGRPLPLFIEVDPAGRPVRELVSRDNDVSYRVYFEEDR